MLYLASITIFPIKSLAGVARTEAMLLDTGALQHDRLFAIFDAQGKVVNGKRTAKVHGLETTFGPEVRSVTIKTKEEKNGRTFHLHEERAALERWLSAYFDFPVQIKENPQGGFPDDTEAPGPTIISQATLATVAGWFPPLAQEEAQRRFRPNLVLAGTEPFWEDRLYAEAGQEVRFQIGQAVFLGVNPCQRCVVPTRHPDTATVTRDFAKVFSERRQETLPAWATAARFNHFYRLAINTRLAPGQTGTPLRLGDKVQLL